MLKNIDYAITNKCNLNCIACFNFSPLVTDRTEYYLKIYQVKSDFELLYKVTNNGSDLEKLTITGGEPLLHPDLSDILILANHYFPNKVTMLSNGLLYKKLISMKSIIIDNNIKLNITKYKLNSTKFILHQLGSEFGNLVTFRSIEGFNNISPLLSRSKLKYLTETDINSCYYKFNCPTYRYGKLYPCIILANYNLLISKNEWLANVIPVEDIYLDLNMVSNAIEIRNWLRTIRPQLCNYCNLIGKFNIVNWKVSKKDRTEWID